MSRPVLHILIVSPNGSFCPLIVCHSVRIWLTCSLACADAGIFARRIQARLPENSSDNVCFRHQLILPFYRGCSMVISKTTIIIQGFREVPTFTIWGVQLFQGDQNANFYRNGYNLWYFKGVRTPYPHFWIRAWLDKDRVGFGNPANTVSRPIIKTPFG